MSLKLGYVEINYPFFLGIKRGFLILTILLFFFSTTAFAIPGCQLPNGDFYIQNVSGTAYTGSPIPWENNAGPTDCRAHINGGPVSGCSVGASGGNLFDVTLLNCDLDGFVPVIFCLLLITVYPMISRLILKVEDL